MVELEKIKEAIESTNTMKKASEKLEIPFSTFKKYAKKYDLYKPNQGRKGIKREFYEDDKIRLPLDKILNGEFPFYCRTHLKRRLLSEGILENKCLECGLDEWHGKNLICQLDHIDGDSTNHRLKNLRMLCPNCHSQTKTFSKNKTPDIPKTKIPYSKMEFVQAVKTSKNYSEIKRKLKLNLKSGNDFIKSMMIKYDLTFDKSERKL